ncbi:MAG: hypothetical protein WC841_03520 [Candidatus Shapirobacteria bacterium]|jgi:hypothetical protein
MNLGERLRKLKEAIGGITVQPGSIRIDCGGGSTRSIGASGYAAVSRTVEPGVIGVSGATWDTKAGTADQVEPPITRIAGLDETFNLIGGDMVLNQPDLDGKGRVRGTSPIMTFSVFVPTEAIKVQGGVVTLRQAAGGGKQTKGEERKKGPGIVTIE